MKCIFICNYGRNRSPTGARIAKEMGLERGLELETEFMALFPEESEEYEEKDKQRLEKCDNVFVMTSEIGDIIAKRYHISGKKVINLDIEDVYDCYGLAGPQMRQMLESTLKEKLDEWIK